MATTRMTPLQKLKKKEQKVLKELLIIRDQIKALKENPELNIPPK